LWIPYQGSLVSLELFTTVIPLIIIGFGYFSGFAENVSPAPCSAVNSASGTRWTNGSARRSGPEP